MNSAGTQKEFSSEVNYPRVKRREISKPFKPFEFISKVFIEREPERVEDLYAWCMNRKKYFVYDDQGELILTGKEDFTSDKLIQMRFENTKDQEVAMFCYYIDKIKQTSFEAYTEDRLKIGSLYEKPITASIPAVYLVLDGKNQPLFNMRRHEGSHDVWVETLEGINIGGFTFEDETLKRHRFGNEFTITVTFPRDLDPSLKILIMSIYGYYDYMYYRKLVWDDPEDDRDEDLSFWTRLLLCLRSLFF